MAVHAGIPVRCLGDLVDVIEQHLLHGRARSGAAVFEWLTEPGLDYRMGKLDVPVQNFLRLGGEVAVDTLDRIIDFIELTGGGLDVSNDLDLDTSVTGLPTILLDGLIEWLRERPFDRLAVEAVATARRRTPIVSFSMRDDRMIVGVPYPESSPQLPWKVSFDGDTYEVYAERGWGVETVGQHPLTPVPIPRPVREIMIRHEGSEAEHRIILMNKVDPLLLFDSEGTLLPRHQALPRDIVVACYPEDSSVIDAATETIVTSLEDLSAPSGWQGWLARSIDLADHNSVQLCRRDTVLGTVRKVRAIGAPIIELAAPLEGLTTVSGLSVYGERPLITLPSVAGAGPETWRVRVRRSGQSEWLVSEDWLSSAERACLDPFAGQPPGLLGLFDVLVSGPLGSDQRATVFIAEGVTVDHDGYFRYPVPRGLSQSVSQISAELPFTVDRELVYFAVADRQMEIVVGSGDYTCKLVLEPPRFEYRIDAVGTPALWRTAPQSLTPEDFEAHAVVVARVPGNVIVVFDLVDPSGAVLQTEVPDEPWDSVFQISTRVFIDTIRRVGAGRLIARIVDPGGDSHQVTMTHIRPVRLCSGVGVDGDYLVLDDPVSDELGAFVWVTTAPWQPVRQWRPKPESDPHVT